VTGFSGSGQAQVTGCCQYGGVGDLFSSCGSCKLAKSDFASCDFYLLLTELCHIFKKKKKNISYLFFFAILTSGDVASASPPLPKLVPSLSKTAYHKVLFTQCR
jgi:hypothetical protein